MTCSAGVSAYGDSFVEEVLHQHDFNSTSQFREVPSLKTVKLFLTWLVRTSNPILDDAEGFYSRSSVEGVINLNRSCKASGVMFRDMVYS